MKRYSKFPVLVALGAALVAVAWATSSTAQCTTCATPVVAYSPVVAPATTVTYTPADTGWYPGKLLDTWRMRRWGYTTGATAVTAAYAPTYSVGYAPTYTAAYAPTYTAAYAPSYTAAYSPYTASYAPAVTTTSYSTPYVTSYAPLTRSVAMRPVVVQSPVVAAASVVSSACTPCCEPVSPCSSCAPATTVVEQATYTAAPAPCVGCAQGSSVTYAQQAPVASSGQTGQPQLTPQEAAPLQSNYPDVTPPQNNGTNNSQLNNAAPQQQQQQRPDPGPAEQNSSDASTYFEAPALFSPGDRTAQQPTVKPANRAPTVDVWNAVYRGTGANDNVSTASHTSSAPTQAEIDAQGWSSVPAN